MTAPDGATEAFTYDARNRPSTATRSVGGSVEHGESYAFNALGAVHTSLDPVAMAPVAFDDQRPRLSGSGTADAAIRNTESWSFDYDAAGRNKAVTYPDGHVRTQSYDNEGRIQSRCYQYGAQSYCYTAQYDPVGNPKVLTDPYGGSDAYTYDALNRLQSVTRTVGGTTEHVETYGYNALGAVHTTFDPVAMAPVTLDDQRPTLAGRGTADSAVPNTLGGQPVTLDPGGRVTAVGGATFTYNTLGRITGSHFPSGAETIDETYRYDSYQRRNTRVHVSTTGTTSTTTTTFYVYDGANLVATVGSSANVQDAYLFGEVDHPLRLRRSGASYFYEVDLAGNVRRLRDSSGADLGGYRYTALGETFAADANAPAAAIDQPLRWKGRWFENVAGGLYEMRARWWSPKMGAFLRVDGFAYHDPNSTLWGFPGQNPIRYSDPSGRWAYVSQTGNSVQITIPIYFNADNPADIQNAVTQIQNTWSGHFGDLDVVAKVQVYNWDPADYGCPSSGVPINHVNLVNSSNAGANSNTPPYGFGRDPAQWIVNSGYSTTFAHETSHLLGLPDQYTNPNDITYGYASGYGGSAPRSPTAASTYNDIVQVIQGNSWGIE